MKFITPSVGGTVYRALCITCYLFCFTIAAIAQAPPPPESIASEYKTTIPSPNVASLLKHTAMPVNGYTGRAEITINIFTIPGERFQLPVSLSYSTSGFNVNELASWVGAGWTLQGTGVVGRTVRDMPDNKESAGFFSDEAKVYFRSNGQPLIDSLFAAALDVEHPDYYSTVDLINGATRNDLATQVNAQGQSVDTEPDLFNYSLPTGASGKFVFNQNKQLRHLSPNGTIIEPSGNLITDFEFEITDTKGNKYYFGDSLYQEYLKSDMLCDNLQGGSIGVPEISAWNLIGIESTTSDESATFSYVNETLEYETGITQTKIVKISAAGTSTQISEPNIDKSCRSSVTAYTKRISQIAANGYTVNFIASGTERLDVEGGHRLQKIIVTHGDDTLKTFELYHSYFKENQFLRLDSIVEMSNGKSLPAHTFQYDDNEPFPYRNSFDQDMWGYFNNASNTVFHPELWIIEFPDPIWNLNAPINRYIPGANREVDTVYAQKGALTKVTYPTGGFAQIEYGYNRYNNFATEKRGTKQSFAPTAPNQSFEVIGTKYSPTLETNYILIKDIGTCEVAVMEGGGIPRNCGMVTIYDENHDPVHLLLNDSKHKILPIPPGTYTVEIGTDPEYGSSFVELEWYDYDGFLTEKKGGGPRVERITYNDGHGNSTRTEWAYKKEDEVASGHIVNEPVPYSVQLYNSGWGMHPDLGFVAAYWMVYSNVEVPMERTAGAYVGYSRVEERNVDLSGGSNGIKVTEFLTVAGTMPNLFPVAPPLMTFDNVGGKPKRELHYREDHGKTLLAENITEYEVTKLDTVWGFRVQPLVINAMNPLLTINHLASHFSEIPSWANATLTTQKQYAGAQVNTTKTFTSYTAHNETSYPFQQTIVTYPVGELNPDSLIIEHYYPFDFAGSPYTTLTSRNFITDPVFTVKYKRDTILGGVLKKYSVTSGHINIKEVLSLPKRTDLSTEDIADLKANPASYFDQEVELEYHANGKRAMARFRDGSRAAYLWDTDQKEIPVAMAVNAEVDQLYYNSFDTLDMLNPPQAGTGYKKLLHSGLPQSYSPAFSPPAGDYAVTYFYRSTGSAPWQLKVRSFTATGSNSFTTPETSGDIDELRIHPKGALVTTYTYRIGKGVTAIQDPNNRFVFYEYDDFGRLALERDNDGNILRKHQYHYRNQQD